MVLTRAASLALRERKNSDTQDAPVGSSTKCAGKNVFKGIFISTWNIVDGQGNRLEMACKQLMRHQIDIAFLTKTKLNGFHTGRLYGYNIIATKCKNRNQGGVALAYRDNKNWHFESIEQHGENVIKGTLVHDNQPVPLLQTLPYILNLQVGR